MRKVKLEQALIDAMEISSSDFEHKKYFMYRAASYIIKAIGGPMSYREMMVFTTENGVIQTPGHCLNVLKIFPGDPLQLGDDKKRKPELYQDLINSIYSINFSQQEDNVVVDPRHISITMLYSAIEENEHGERIVYDILIPAISSYILYKEIYKDKFKAAKLGRQSYYMLRDMERSLKNEYSNHIINARAEMRYFETRERNSFDTIRREDDYHEYTD